MKFLLPIILIGFFINSCNKSNVKGDLSGKEYIRGRLFLYDTLTQWALGTPLSNKTINISYRDSPDTLNYLFSTKTNDQGYFTFENLKANVKYRLYYEEKINDIYYTAKTFSNASVDTLRVYADLAINKQNGIFYQITDKTGGPVKGAKVCIFSNLTSFNSGVCDASNYSLTSDDHGRAYKFNISHGIYYVQGSILLNNTNYRFKDTVSVENTIVFTKKTLTEVTTNGFNYTVLDTTYNRIGGASLCIFTSQVLFNRDTCDGSNFQVQSDIYGIATKTDLQPGRYLIYANIKQGNIIYYDKDTINISNSIINDTLILKRKKF